MGKRLIYFSLCTSFFLHLLFLGFSPHLKLKPLKGVRRIVEKSIRTRLEPSPLYVPPPVSSVSPWKEEITWKPEWKGEMEKLPPPPETFSEILPPPEAEFKQEIVSLSSDLLTYKPFLHPRRKVKREKGDTPFSGMGFDIKKVVSPSEKLLSPEETISPSPSLSSLPPPAIPLTLPSSPSLLSPGREKKFIFWDELFRIEVMQYPQGDDHYFRVRVIPRKETSLSSIPREVIFLVDSSKSITPQKWEIFRKGVRIALGTLRNTDLFNLVIFRERVFPWRKTSVPAHPDNIREAVRFLEKFSPSGETDIYSALSRWIRAGGRYREIFLFTDGRPTYGFTSLRDFVLTLSPPPPRIAIFTLAVGEKVNLLFLNLLSRFGRGELFYRRFGRDFLKELPYFFHRFSTPLLVDIRIKGKKAELYPLFPGNLYQNTPLEFVGRTGENRVIFRLTGVRDGKPREIVFERRMEEIPRGEKAMVEDWNRYRMYETIRELVLEGGREEEVKRVIPGARP